MSAYMYDWTIQSTKHHSSSYCCFLVVVVVIVVFLFSGSHAWCLSVLTLQFFSGHFDTKIGPKVECDSYKKISESIECQPSKVLFVTDVVKGTFIDFYFLFYLFGPIVTDCRVTNSNLQARTILCLLIQIYNF